MARRLIIFSMMGILFYGPSASAESGVAHIHATDGKSDLYGEAAFNDTPEGLKVVEELANASPGKHGFHIHENGFCNDNGNAAGGHYNPENTLHGELIKHGFEQAHAGDFGNIEIAPDGTGRLEMVLPGLTLTGGKYNVAGRSVIVHEKEDDFGQPAGNAGGRIGCGIIELTSQ